MNDPFTITTKVTIELVAQGEGVEPELLEYFACEPYEALRSALECVEFAKVTVEVNGKMILEQDPPKEKSDES